MAITTAQIAFAAPAAALEPYETVLVSRQNDADGGQQHDGDTMGLPAISGDGRFVAFHAESTNLVPGASGWAVYLRDLGTGTTSLVASPALAPSLSHDGRFVVYDSAPEGDEGIYVLDRQTGERTLVSRYSGPNGAPAPEGGHDASISANGRYVLFRSGTDLIPGRRDSIFVRDLKTDRLTSIDPPRPRKPSLTDARLSADGRFAVVGQTDETGPNAEDYRFRIWLVDVRTRKARLIYKLNRNGLDDRSDHVAISADGRYVVFDAAERILTIYDAKTRRRKPVSRRSLVRLGAYPDISDSGRYVSFYTVEVGTIGREHAWLYDRRRDRLHRISRASGRAGKRAGGFAPSLSANGRIAAFNSNDNTLLRDDQEQVFARWVLP